MGLREAAGVVDDAPSEASVAGAPPGGRVLCCPGLCTGPGALAEGSVAHSTEVTHVTPGLTLCTEHTLLASRFRRRSLPFHLVAGTRPVE